ncbi:hypothetical protein ABPG75_011352 [Micractinium tetrahymenae]
MSTSAWLSSLESDAEWLTAAAAGGGGARQRPLPLSLLDGDLGQASAELQELCRLQLQLLTASLQLSLQAVLTAGVSGSASSLDDEDCLRQPEGAALRLTVYCRAPASLQTGQLQLQLVADLDGADGGGGGGGAARSARAQQAQRFLFLGEDGGAGASLADQERWIVEQPVIVLPDSGGLVLPLASNGFLVGLLVVERCSEEGEAAPTSAAVIEDVGAEQAPAQAAAGPAAGGPAPEAAGAASGGSGGRGGMPPPPACLLFRSAELQLIKQTAAVLALACAMDLRAALERAGAAYRQRQASALVQAAKKPLTVMRTLGTMLLPRLQPGEPDRDFAQGILEQGQRLQEVVSQLQAALHPAAVAAAVPPALQPGSPPMGRVGSTAPRLPASSSSSSSSLLGSGAMGSGEWQLAEQPRPALPSSSIGSDYQWGGSEMAGSTIDLSIDSADASPSAASSVQRADSSSGSNGTGPPAPVPALAAAAAASPSGAPYGSRASADLLNVLMPLLASASNFAAVSGVTFVMADATGSSKAGDLPVPAAAGGQRAPLAPQALSLPAAEVAVGPGKLKRMLSQLIDGIIACAARGDLVQASVLPQGWQGRPGVAIALCCCYSLTHGSSASNGSSGDTAGSLPRPPLKPEFAFLRGSAAEAGGWFEVHAEPPDVRHGNSSSLAATLWLPTVVRDAGWS